MEPRTSNLVLFAELGAVVFIPTVPLEFISRNLLLEWSEMLKLVLLVIPVTFLPIFQSVPELAPMYMAELVAPDVVF